MKKPTLQDLIKKHLNGYKPSYHGLTYDGKNIYPKVKGIGLKQVNNFLKEIDLYYSFEIKNNSIIEPFEKDEDNYIYFVRDHTRNGFQLYSD